MPILKSTFKPRLLFKNGFVSTVYSGLIRKVTLEQTRERIETRDADFLDLDWSYADASTALSTSTSTALSSSEKSDSVIILLHGLEGHAQRPYVTGTAKLLNQNGVDAVCMNFRGCSGEDNRFYKSYHSGATNDLDDVVNHCIQKKKYSKIYIKGISLGGNVVLKYLGEDRVLPSQIKAGIGISVPAHLDGSSTELQKLKNRPFAIRFRQHLLDKLKIKQKQFPEILKDTNLDQIKTLRAFDDFYTSKAHGFKDAMDYYTQCSSLQFLPNIKVPTLIISALNDSFLSAKCYPVKAAKQNESLHLEMPDFGGHVGFISKNNVYYNEKRALEFIKQLET